MKKVFAKSGPEWTLLKDHLLHVAQASQAFAEEIGMDTQIAYEGAILHDIGKYHPEFQRRLFKRKRDEITFRHEIASMFFLSAFPKDHHHALIEMVAAHHKSVKNDVGEKGLLDLDKLGEYEDFHLGDWEAWSPGAFELLQELKINCQPYTRDQALGSLEDTVDYCHQVSRTRGYSEWRGLLMGADHFASEAINDTQDCLQRAFRVPNLAFFNRTHKLYPLSEKDTTSSHKHTIVVACTGAGKTDFLFKRTRKRVFYTLPFQASINAMYHRLSNDLEETNPELDIRVLHSASQVVSRKKGQEETPLQSQFGAAIKVLTPHQLAAAAFGMKGFEAMMLDLRGNDVILDEVHTYSGVSQAIVLKLVEVLKSIDCRIHIGTATMPTALYEQIKSLLGTDVLEVKLQPEELDQFNRHKTLKIGSFEEDLTPVIDEAIDQNQKTLVICNRVDRAIATYQRLEDLYPDVPMLLLHSRYKRGDRNEKEQTLVGLDAHGKPTGNFNTSEDACIVVSTQIVEVSLDISFDVMITECAPIDALIQRLGRVNRRRSESTIGQLKNIYVAAPPEGKREAKPYDLETLQRSYAVLPDGEVFAERSLQEKIDQVFPSIDFWDIENLAVFKSDGQFTMNRLTHNKKSILLELLDIDSVACITESDRDGYEKASSRDRLMMEIPARHHQVKDMEQLPIGHRPFIIPDKAYSLKVGLEIQKVTNSNLDKTEQFI